MAQVKNFVARKMDNGYSVKKILAKVVKNEEYTKWDVVKTVLWWCWFKLTCNCVANFIMDYVVRPILKCGAVGLAIVVMLIIFCVSIVVLATLGVLSPLWYSLMIWLAPAKAADLIIDEREGEEKKWWLILDLPYSLASNIIFTIVMPLFWGWIWRSLPMKKQKFYIDADPNINIKELSLQSQLDYYDEQSSAKDKVATIKCISREAMREIWNRGKVADRENILQVYILGKDDGMLLLNNDNEQFMLLARYCANKENDLTSELQLAFVHALEDNEVDKKNNAFKILHVCCKKRSLENETIIALVKLLGSITEAKELLNLYWSKNTLSNEVVKALMETATSDFADEQKNLAYELLLQVVRRDGITPEMAEQFYEHCSGTQEQEMDYLVKMHMDFQMIDWQCTSAEDEKHVKKLKQYFELRKQIAPEAQSLMREWQYRIFRETNHELDEKVLNELLTKRLQERDIAFFQLVFDEGIERDVITDTTNKLMLMVPWKRQLVLDAAEKAKAQEGIAL